MSLPASEGALLEVEGLTTRIVSEGRSFLAVDAVSFSLSAGRTLGIVGESGCGKSRAALPMLRLVPEPPARIVGGRVRFDGRDLLALEEKEMRAVRGAKIAIVFQEPMTSLNPLMRAGRQVAEPLELHRGLRRAAARAKVLELFAMVGIPDPERCFEAWPHELSGGMRQRVMIAMALSCEPKVLIADEPTAALDVTVQAQLLSVLEHLQRERGMAMLLITHDLGLVAETCDEVAVMYAGRIVERAPVRELFRQPLHPYTAALLASLPSRARLGRLPAIAGSVPSLWALPRGCRFRDRFSRAVDACVAADPPLEPVGSRWVACHNRVA